jgi:tetratricopeptide (TPR) repeat protein
MAKLARLPAFDRSRRADADVRVPRLRTRFYAFLSYSHKDSELADWLHRELERFRVPHTLAGKLTANGVVPRRLVPIFRDQHDLSAGGDLAEEIKAALAASQFLVVLCSPTAAKSRWTNQEIESFKRTRPEGCVLAAIVAGEPFASDMPGREEEECFPPALRYKYDRRGHQTAKRAEPLAADFREGGEGKRLAFLKLVAGMLGVGLDELVQRDQIRRQRRLAYLAAASIAGMAVTSTLAVTAFQARNEAREQRRQAEGLVAFMLGDLKDKLEPIGRLDALDGVGERVLAYYQKQGTSDLSDQALSQRSSALSLMAQVADARGDTNVALNLYREAMAGTAEAMRRNPRDPEAIFNHAQNVFYIGQIAHNRGDFRAEEASMREYRRLSLREVALAPDNMKYRMEEEYADTNLAVALSDQRRFAEAAAQYSAALQTIEAIATADPSNKDYRQGVAEALAWLADAQRAMGDFKAATASRLRDIAVLQKLFGTTNDTDYQNRLIPALRSLGTLYNEQGQPERATAAFQSAVDTADALVPKEPTNTLWLEYSYKAKQDLGRQLLVTGNKAEASRQIGAGCAIVDDLTKRDPKNREWQIGMTRCLGLRARLALSTGAKDQALKYSTAAVTTAQQVHGGDPVNHAYVVAEYHLLVGDTELALGDRAAAQSAWNAGLSQLPAKVAEEPYQMAERMQLLKRLGRGVEAQALATKLARIGFRDPRWIS